MQHPNYTHYPSGPPLPPPPHGLYQLHGQQQQQQQFPPAPYPQPAAFAFDGYRFSYYPAVLAAAPPYAHPQPDQRREYAAAAQRTQALIARDYDGDNDGADGAYAAGTLARPRRKRVSAILAERLHAGDARGASKASEVGNGSGSSSSAIGGTERKQRSSQQQQQQQQQQQLKKEPRRRTIYIPDDTTVLTIHPGATRTLTDGTLRAAAFAGAAARAAREQTPDCGLELVTLSEEETEAPLVSALKKTGPAARKSLAVAPRRAPLKESGRPRQSVAFADDVLDAETGKENRPPGMMLQQQQSYGGGDAAVADKASKAAAGLKQKAKRRSTIVPGGGFFGGSGSSASGVSKRVSILVPATKASIDIERERTDLKAGHAKATPKKRLPSETGFVRESERSPRLRKTAAAPTVKKAHARLIHQRQQSRHSHQRLPSAGDLSDADADRKAQEGTTKKSSAQVRDSTSTITSSATEHGPKMVPTTSPLLSARFEPSASANMARYPVLNEDIARPELYEEHWLEHQEVTLTELLNLILVPETDRRPAGDAASSLKDLRRLLLAIYQETSFSLLFKRLTASLQYGALCLTREVIEKSVKIRDDVGLRKKFVALFLETYSLPLLRAALEVIAGRECPVPAVRASGQLNDAEKKEKEVKVERKAIARFLDACFIQHSDVVQRRPGVGTIGAIARAAERAARTEEHGSYTWSWRRTVLRSLMLVRLLDVAKTRQATDECLFQSSSLYKSSAAVLQAIGILLLPSVGDILKPLRNLDYAVATVQYPLQEYRYKIVNLATDLRDGVRLTRLIELLLFGPTVDDDYPLSQHLKFPCPDRARKFHNVQVALSAFASMGGPSAQLCRNIGADDVVDGHREKTISLLWGLVSRVGLAALLDWKQLKAEIGRLLAQGLSKHEAERNRLSLEEVDHETALRLWAHSIAVPAGLKVANLTTSFADGKVLEAIVDEYFPFVAGASDNLRASLSKSTVTARSSLSSKLKAVGFSKAFVSLFDVTLGIPSSQSTVTTLSLLASRFIPLLAPHRAAVVLQRNVRCFLARRAAHRRVVLMRLAHHCSVIVAAREKLVGAATVLQRAWRATLQRRHQRLMCEAEGLQALARGFLVRKALRKAKHKTRIRGGWW